MAEAQSKTPPKKPEVKTPEAKKPAPKKPVGKPGEPVVVTAVNDKHQLCMARFSPCGKLLVGGGMTGEIFRWDAAAADDVFTPLPVYAGHGGWVGAIEFAPTGSRLFSGDSWGRLSAWGYASKETKPLWSVADAHAGWLRSLAVSPDGKTVATCGADRLVRLWDAASGKRIAELPGHVEDVFSVAFSLDGVTLASGDLLGGVKLWDVKTRKVLRECDAKTLAKEDRLQNVGGVRLLRFMPDGKQLLVGGTQPKNGGNVQGTPTLLMFDVASGKQTKLLDLGAGQVYIHDLQFLPSGDWALVLSGNPGSGKFALHKSGEAKPYFETTKLSNCHGVSIHPNGRRIAVMAMNPNSAGNGRTKSKDGSQEYPGNWSPLHILDITA